MEKIRNAYPSEQKQLYRREKEDMLVMLQIMDVLDENGYSLDAVLENGMPLIVLNKNS